MVKKLNQKKSWYVYLIENTKGQIYTGITTDVHRRFSEHKMGPKAGGAKFFSASKPKKILYVEEAKNRSSATKREIAIKKMGRKEKIKLFNLTL